MTVENYNGVIIDYARDRDLPEQGLAMLTKKGFYKKEHEKSPHQGFARAASCFSFGDAEFAQFMYDAMSKHWLTNASPVQTNAVDIIWPTFNKHQFHEASDWLAENVDPDGMPISCFLPYIPDTKEGLVETRKETAWLSMMGGGIGVYAANRSPDEKSTGVMAHLKGYDADVMSYRQTASRRGSVGVYLDIDHPEVLAFIDMRNPVGGDQSTKCFNLNNAVNLTDEFMIAMIKGDDYELIDPKHGRTRRFLSARTVWRKLMDDRYETGEPYLNFIDTVNRNIPEWITNPLYRVVQSNLCSEIELMTSAIRTAVCCLSSLNLEKYDEWKNSGLVGKLIRYLDNVLEYFIRLAPPELERAIYSAQKERALGMGTLGWHSLLQSKDIPFESGGIGSASQLTSTIYADIKRQAIEASLKLGAQRGVPDDCEGSGMRNSHLMAIAPNASTSSLIGVSPSIEPWAAVAFNAQGRAGSFLIMNKYFDAVLDRYQGIDKEDIWKQIIADDGSVQGLKFLSDHEKKVFKTFKEIDPQWIIELASLRQPHVCQSQSLNIKMAVKTTAQYMSDVHVLAWARGVKSLYYCRAEAASTADIGTGGERPLGAIAVKREVKFEECLPCEG